jgi:FG-GAP-like repeat
MKRSTEAVSSDVAMILVLLSGMTLGSCLVPVTVAVEPVQDGGPGSDGGPPDAGPPDAGPPDGGPPDAGPPDAGPPDGGSTACVIGGLTYPSRASNPSDARQCCNPAANPHGWTYWLIPNGTFSVGPGPVGLVAADLDGDGKIDVAVTHLQGLSILLQGTGGTFTRQVDAQGAGANSVEVRRLTPGSLPDLVTTTRDENLQVFVNLGNGTFAPPHDFYSGQTPLACVVNSWTGGAAPDLFCINLFGNGGSLLPGLADGGFAAARGLSLPNGPWSMTSGDFRGIGRLDIAVSHQGANEISILLDSGGGIFGGPTTIPGVPGPFGLVAKDCDRDQLVDLVVVHEGEAKLGFMKGKGDGTFAPSVDYPAGNDPNWVAVADVNGDGWPDAVVASAGDNTVRVLWNQGAQGGFSISSAFTVGNRPVRLVTADFNGDGAPDVAVTNTADDKVEVLLNGCP